MITAENVCKDYHSETGRGWNRVLSGVSFTVSPGEKVAILGRNGAGKSTLIRMICRLYDKPFAITRDYVEDFAQLGKYLSEPVRSYSAGMRARLNFAISLAIDFDCYLVDEIITVGDQRLQRRSHEELFGRRADRCLVLASHSPEI